MHYFDIKLQESNRGTQEDGEWKLPLCNVMAPTLHPVENLRHWCPKRSTVQQMPANKVSYLLGCHSHQFPEIRSFHLHCHLVLTALLEQPCFDKFYYAFRQALSSPTYTFASCIPLVSRYVLYIPNGTLLVGRVPK